MVVSFFLFCEDGCLPESTTFFGSVEFDWPEIGAGEVALLPCPCGEIVSRIRLTLFLYIQMFFFFLVQSDTTGLTANRMCQGDFVSLSEWLNPQTTQCEYDEYSQQLCNAAAVSVR